MFVIRSMLSTIIGMLIAFSNIGATAETYDTNMWDAKAFTQLADRNGNLLRFLSFGLIKPNRFTITFDETLEEMFTVLEENSGFRVQDVMDALPDFYALNRWLVSVFPDFYYEQRDSLVAKGDALSGSGEGFKMAMYRLFGLSFAMPTKVHMFTEQIGDTMEYRVYMRFIYADGSERVLNTNSTYNKETRMFGEKGGVGGLGYNLNIGDSYAYTNASSFQRSLGYTKLYDDLLLKTTKMVNATTVRLKFPYAGKNWMLQLWKGRYFMTTGGEVGLYNKPTSRWYDFYDCASNDEMIGMTFKLTAHDNGEDIVLVNREMIQHWWMTGFAIRDRIYTSERLTLESVITPTDADMKAGLVTALKEQAAKKVLTFEEMPDGLSLLIRW